MQAYPCPLPVSWRATANEGLKVPNLRLQILPKAESAYAPSGLHKQTHSLLRADQ